MSLSRWKMMAGVLGVSLGGLAAAASQCPKLDKTKGRQPEIPVSTAEAPKVPPAGAPAPTYPFPALPEVPVATPEPKPAKEPAKPMDTTPPPPVIATGGELPALPALPTADTKTPVEPKTPMPTGLGTLPPPTPEVVKPITPTPPVFEIPSKPSTPVTSPTPSAPVGVELPGKPPATPPSSAPVIPPASGGTAPASPPGVIDLTPPLDVQPTRPATPPSPIVPDGGTTSMEIKHAAVAAKFRIVLRVGEGDPTFEVRHNDDVVLKVACEKVDIKSPEKGQGPSEVIARGKVRFAGFGAEGTCDSLSFLAGTGEVSMAGRVKVQVKDKLGRVESELSGEAVKYKIDASATNGSIKP